MHSLLKFLIISALAAPLLGPAQTAVQGPSDWAQGEIRKVDKAAGKITIRHGEIKSLDMPPMTMVFVAKDLASLDKFKVGDKIRFNATQEAGKMVVTDLQPAP